jgi:hypothetical protein
LIELADTFAQNDHIALATYHIPEYLLAKINE